MRNTLQSLIIPFLIFSVSTASKAQDPNEMAVPSVWLRADSISSGASVWRDVSFNGNNAQITGTAALGDLINYNPSVSFTEDETYTLPYNIEPLSELTFMLVYTSTDTTEYGLLTTAQATHRPLQITTHRVVGPDSLVDEYTSTTSTFLLETITQKWEDLNFDETTSQLILGKGKDGSKVGALKGNFAELLIFDKTLNFLDRIKWETYLALKYGISLKEKNYVNSNNDLLWSYEKTATYSNSIFGVSRDDEFGLYQRQALPADDTTSLLSLSAGQDFYELNSDNPVYLVDGTYLLLGHNGLPATVSKGEGADSVLQYVDRKWYASAKYSHESTLTVDLSGIMTDSLGFWLGVDASGSGNFTSGNLQYIAADSISSDSVAYYHNVPWDQDKSGADHMALVKKQELFAAIRTLQKPLCTDPETGVMLVDMISGTAPYALRWKNVTDSEFRSDNFSSSLELTDLAAGSYYFKVTDARGHQYEQYAELTYANGIIINLGGDQELSSGEVITIDAAAGIPDSLEVTYEWEGSFGFSSSQPKIDISESGIYTVYVTNQANGCVFSESVVISGSVVERFAVFPNPIRQTAPFNISISLKDVDNVEVKLFDLKGDLHATFTGQGRAEYQFKASVPTGGQYFITVQTPSGRDTKKIVIY